MSGFWNFKVGRNVLLSILLVVIPPISVFFILRYFFLDDILYGAQLGDSWVLIAKGVYLLALGVSAIVGSVLSQMFNKRRLFTGIIFFRLFSPFLILFFSSGLYVLIPCLFLGASFGLGFPLDLAFLADHTYQEERGRVSGFVLSLTFITFFVLSTVSGIFGFSLTQNTLLLVFLQLLSFGALMMGSLWGENVLPGLSGDPVWKNRVFLMYLLPWSMFSLVNGAVIFLWELVVLSEISAASVVVKYVGSIVFFIVAGIITDYYGRKPALLLGFVLLGFSYFMFPAISSPLIDLIVGLFTGVAWSFIMVSFLFTVVGDLSAGGSRAVYFAVSGVLWILIETGFAFVSGIVHLRLPVGVVSSILSLVMFLCIMPLLYLPETLPRSKIVDRRMSDYFERVLKALEDSD